MKERNQFYFITALSVSMIFIISIVIRFTAWFDSYGVFAMPPYYYYIIPLALLWFGWVFEHKAFLFAASILMAVVFGVHMDSAGVLNNSIRVISAYAPIVRTLFVLNFVLILASVGFGFYTYYTLEKK